MSLVPFLGDKFQSDFYMINSSVLWDYKSFSAGDKILLSCNYTINYRALNFLVISLNSREMRKKERNRN
jgi:hypothetical protein